MSTTHHQVAGKCNSSGTRARVKWLLRRRSIGSLFPRFLGPFGARSGKVADKKCTGLQRELDLHFKIANCLGRGTFWRGGRHRSAKYARDYSEILVLRNNRRKLGGSERCQICTVKSPMSALRERWSIWWVLLYAFAPGCDKTQWRGRTAKHDWCCDAPGKRDCSWRLRNGLYELRGR